MQTQDQKRAKDAYDKVKELSPDRQSKFKTLALKFPSMVLQCGVLQGLAFQQKENKGIFRELDDWLCNKSDLAWGGIQRKNIVDRLCDKKMDISRYRLITREAVAYGTWLKRAAEVLLREVRTEN